MTVLRSRKVVSVVQKEHSDKLLEKGDQIEPVTPAKEVESMNKSSNDTTPSPHKLVESSDKLGLVGSMESVSVSNQGLRRSARLSSKSTSPCNVLESVGSSRRKRKVVNRGNDEEPSVINGSESVVSDVRASIGLDSPSELVSALGTDGFDKEETPSVKKVKSGSLLSQDVQFLGSESVQEGDVVGGKSLTLRSGKKLLKPGVKNVASDEGLSPCQDEKGTEEGKSETVVNGVSQVNLEIEAKGGSSGNRNDGDIGERTGKRFSREDKQKGVLVNGDDGGEEMETGDVNDTIKRSNSRLSIEEKGKGKLPEVDSPSNGSDMNDSEKPKVGSLMDSTTADTVNLQHETIERAGTSARNKERFKKTARENASRFAYFSVQEEQEDPPVDEDELEPAQTEASKDEEDWPGPFSTAMKIKKDRSAKTGQQNNLTSEKLPSVPLVWVPKVIQKEFVKRAAPLLQELCMSLLAENVDAISSLVNVPDVIRHNLTQLLCDCRTMSHHFFELLASGSPSEIRVRDCSWLTEEQFARTFKKTDTSKLTVLQLDQCGRCLPDYVIFTTLAHSNLSALTNISVRGACRLSDAGLNVLLTSAPALRSINLGCCSLLTSNGIINLADKLGPMLKELYIDECFSLDAMQILPALLKLEHLEVLSLSRIETVNDSFIKKLVGVRGQNIKELVLADCTKLTDKSLKAIAESCPGLCSIDLTRVCKLTDTAIGHLANGCRGIQTMKFCRNAFSDEAVAAFIEVCGQSLKELSLNHVDMVANHTALALSKHARDLQRLDLSWCRNITNEAVGLIVDSCLSLKTLILFGCTQITDVFLDGHSNEKVKVIGLKGSQILKNIDMADLLPLRYSSAA